MRCGVKAKSAAYRRPGLTVPYKDALLAFGIYSAHYPPRVLSQRRPMLIKTYTVPSPILTTPGQTNVVYPRNSKACGALSQTSLRRTSKYKCLL